MDGTVLTTVQYAVFTSLIKRITNYVSLMASSIHHFHFSTKFSFSALNTIFSMAVAGWVSWNTRDGDDAPVS